MTDAESLTKRADELAAEQRAERGYHKGRDLDGKPCQLPNPYQPTPENERRAKEIIRLRKRAARL